MKPFLFFSFCFFSFSSWSQAIDSISPNEVQRILNFLSSDSLKGRQNNTPELQSAANFIAAEFKKDSLQYFIGNTSYLQPFIISSISKKEIQKILAGQYDPAKVLLNVVGVLEGKSLVNEAIIFCAHYDHIGTNGRKKGDNIFNGANDNASGTAAVLSLAHYFALKKNNERTLIFCAFAGEELGLLGSQAFAQNIQPEKIVAVINIEMIGSSGAGKKNSFFITGNNYSDLGMILNKNLKNQEVRIRTEPDLASELFKRSDNYSFALKGIPAHSLMSSDDTEMCYHKECDEVKRIDIENMTRIIKAISSAVSSLIDGTDTPARINTDKINPW